MVDTLLVCYVLLLFVCFVLLLFLLGFFFFFFFFFGGGGLWKGECSVCFVLHTLMDSHDFNIDYR